MQRRHRLVSLEGNIGSGKSTLLDAVILALRDDPTTTVLHEPVERWAAPVLNSADGKGMLQAYYDDPKSNGFAFQMLVLLSRIEQYQVPRPGVHTVLSERCVLSDYELFGRSMRESGLLDDVQWTTYTAWTDYARRQHAVQQSQPHYVVYLRVSPEVSMCRIARRGRAGEDAIVREYIEKLHTAHESWIAEVRRDPEARVLVLDGDLEGAGAVLTHANAIVEFLSTLQSPLGGDGRE